jgi:hypothetical protein
MAWGGEANTVAATANQETIRPKHYKKRARSRRPV